MIVLLTRHAKERMAEKGVSVGMIKEAISKGAVIRQTEGYLATYTYLAVAYKIVKPGVYKVKTVMIR